MTAKSNNWHKNFIFLVSVFSAIFVFNGWVNQDIALLSFDIQSSVPSHGQVYWASAQPFSEERVKHFPVTTQKQSVTIALPENATEFRLDPIVEQSNFSISNIKLRQTLCMSWIEGLCSHNYDIEDAVATNEIRRHSDPDQLDFVSTGNDPFFHWKKDPEDSADVLVRAFVAGFLPALALSFLILLVSFGLAQKIDHKWVVRRVPYSTALLLLLYPLASSIFASIDQSYRSSLTDQVLFLGVLLFFSVSFLNFSQNGSTQGVALRLTVTGLVLSLILPDFLFHLGFNSRPFAGGEPTEYHWRIGRTYQDNFDHSSLKYINELTEIDELTSAESIFLTDVATSYYLASLTDSFVRVVHPHHFVDKFSIEGELYKRLCQSLTQQSRFTDAKRILKDYKVTHVLLNKDQNNRNVKTFCHGGQNRPTLRSNLGQLGKIIYTSNNFDLYALYIL
jgi:hypothetical protein